jgi:prephenate dehydratase
MTRRLAYLGPAGSYTEQVALNYDSSAEFLPYPSVPAVVAAVRSGDVDEGVVPIENSLEGSVTSTVDLLIHESDVMIRHERVLEIEHCLMAQQGTERGRIQTIYSHPQALAQCRAFLAESFPDAQLVASLSTSAAVEQMQRSDLAAAAIANERCATLYGAEVLDRGVQDDSSNQTRFVVLAPTDHPPTGSDKTSICFEFDADASGILYTVLGELATRKINLTKIESRPTRRSLGRYIFLVDMEGHREDSIVRQALDGVESQVSLFKVLGSYPMHVSSAV